MSVLHDRAGQMSGVNDRAESDVFLKIQGCESRLDVRVKNLKNRLTNINENYRYDN
jgi:hypothetical protein